MLCLRVECRGGLIEDQQQWVVAHEATGQRQLLPLPEAHIHALRPGRTQLGVEPGDEALHHVVGARPGHRTGDGLLIVRTWQVAHADRLPCSELEPEEVLERAGYAPPPGVR